MCWDLDQVDCDWPQSCCVFNFYRTSRPKRYKTDSYKNLGAIVGYEESTVRKRLWWLGWCKARLRDGLCDYCYLWRTRESRQINGFLDGLKERLEALGDHCFTEWLEATKTHALFSKPGFERAASPKYLNALATFLESHCLPTSQDLVKRFFFLANHIKSHTKQKQNRAPTKS